MAHLVDEKGNDPLHAVQVVVVTAVDVAETEDKIAKAITLGVGVNEGFAGDFAG
jgi:hypothetical protein